MRSGKKLSFGLFSVVLALTAMLVTACGGSATTSKPTPAPASQQNFRIAMGGTSDIATFDPAEVGDINSSTVIVNVFTGLVEENNQLQVQPQMATWTISPDNLTYTFHLKPNLKFSDGTPLTAHDVAYSIDRALSPTVSNAGGVSLTYLGHVKDATARANGTKSTLIGDSINVIDDNTVTITIDQPTAYFLEALTYSTAYVVEKKVIDQWGDKWTDHLSDNGGQGGNGPWMVQKYDHSTGITLVPNPYYYGPKPGLKKLQYIFYADDATAYKAYQAGQVDTAGVPTADIASASQNKAEYKTSPVLGLHYVGMNYLTKPFDNIDIRQAFSAAINRDIMAADIEKGTVTPSCHIVPQGQPGYDANLKCPGGAPTKGDATIARRLFDAGLQQEGLTRATFPQVTFYYYTGSQEVADQVTTMIQAWQTVLGVTVKGQATDLNTLITDLGPTTCSTPDNPAPCAGKGMQMWYLGYTVDYPDPQDWTTLQLGPGSSNNNENYGDNLSTAAASQQQIQQEMLQADSSMAPNRMALYNHIEEALVNDVAWMSLYQRESAYVLKSYVQGYYLNAQELVPPDFWSGVYISVH